MNSDSPSNLSGTDPTTTNVTSSLGDTVQSAAPSSHSTRFTTTGSMGDSLRTELSNLKSDLRTLMSRFSNMSEEEKNQQREQLKAKYDSARTAARGMAEQAEHEIGRAMDCTAEYVKQKPLQSVAIAAGIGMVIGMLMKRH